MHIHILGICGTFMGGIALIARAAGHKVTGCDQNVYPPMSTELAAAGIEIMQGFGAEQLDLHPDLLVVGNVMKRGMPVIERMLNEKLPYMSGPQWLYEHYLRDREVLAVAGTHGKTTTTAMLTWILEVCGRNPGFLIGGVPGNFPQSARTTDSPYFVIEADEYDCAFFDKRSKFLHYHPTVAVLNNLEYDHADIFDNIEAIKKQFHHLVRTIPGRGTVVVPADDDNIKDVLSRGLWSERCVFAGPEGYEARLLNAEGSRCTLLYRGQELGEFTLPCCGSHNVRNALAAVAAAAAVGIEPLQAATALSSFRLPRRRQQLIASAGGVEIYDDFAHHPTAVRVTLEGLRAHVGGECRILAVFEPRSNSMKMGANGEALASSFDAADEVYVYKSPAVHFAVEEALAACPRPHQVFTDFDELYAAVCRQFSGRTAVICMSNGSFGGLVPRLQQALTGQTAAD